MPSYKQLIYPKLAASYGETYREVFDWTNKEFRRRGWNKDYTFKPFRARIRRNKPYFRAATKQYNLANYYYHTRDRGYYYP